MLLECNINQKDIAVEIADTDILLDILRDRLGFTSVKRGCENGECGACTILIDEEPVNSCIYLAVRAQGKHIITLEGLGTPDKLHPLQKNFREAGAVQCGFCASGMILIAKALLDKNPDPSENEIREGISGNLCRCSGYVKIIEAIKNTAEEMKEEG